MRCAAAITSEFSLATNSAPALFIYKDWTQEIVPLVFGLNVWNYDLYHTKRAMKPI